MSSFLVSISLVDCTFFGKCSLRGFIIFCSFSENVAALDDIAISHNNGNLWICFMHFSVSHSHLSRRTPQKCQSINFVMRFTISELSAGYFISFHIIKISQFERHFWHAVLNGFHCCWHDAFSVGLFVFDNVVATGSSI